jgi:hypothetical protein
MTNTFQNIGVINFDRTAPNSRFGNMAGRRIYSQLFIRKSPSGPADQ